MVSVKEFSGDVRRYYQITELAPELDVLCGTDDVALELAIAGSPGWISGYPNALPQASAAAAGARSGTAGARSPGHPWMRPWDSRTEFVQAIKLSMEIVGRYGGPSRPPRLPLTDEQAAQVRKDTERVVAEGLA
ncbi:dihydrodipicolinate synthase family protein [Saccharopolyspora sp. ASAGF58]|uniref:dihydrodipicolinate synthase family protein n=1 Tax=Saccharopolyspora sp. ASAGF58 TaxID=2719023 RepID=UPI001FF0854C|nr:dihydrodipicolinate synthase family protein [Saccharopolyspora sp. ASAGF58]